MILEPFGGPGDPTQQLLDPLGGALIQEREAARFLPSTHPPGANRTPRCRAAASFYEPDTRGRQHAIGDRTRHCQF